ncbi:MATE family efflux transporter [Schinkia azotoformans]|uniref:MATE family efflux transporter n=1 Tax=Schinkia azotoformans TaxID=1454 RepID=UPI002DB874BA|nr:MATE family efflux transporter [Schinkia azotoformans]MEC1698109.1 MATE family efflux transporter [Schinkia azotoformans]MEC1725769.1 MATE family efflux transporter [Schinkia azotoformans]MEC1742061.1 MATE family efflux transporter [Schinkia azotoformans]MEC1766297.1 MATE family efflux transporter [Schinkia azotoformans]MEC1772934.1 MATE family efflux transporter [Schinkia azotoformans]
MEQTYTLKQKLLFFIKILFPILVTQIGLYAMNFFDTMMSGRASADDLAGVAIGSSLWMPIFTLVNGILLAITPIIAQLVGAKNTRNVPFSIIQGVYLSIVIAGIILILGFVAIDPILNTMSLTTEVSYIAKHYLIGLGFGVIPLVIYTVLRCFIDALGHTRVTMVITLSSLPINVILNYVFIFGKLGFPELGGIGTGYATAITYWVILGFALFVVIKLAPFRPFQLFRTLYPVQFKTWKEILKIGLPIGFAMFFETSIFAAVTLLMSEYNTLTIASHQAAMNFASYLYMIPLSISMALTIVVGFEVGAKRFKDAKIYSFLGISFAIVMALITSVLLYFLRESVAGLYTNDVQVLELTTHFLLYAILFQLSDAFGAPIQGALRGYKDVNATFIVALISYWLIGLPTGFLLAKYTSLAAFGYWIGLIIGLAVGAIMLFGRLFIIQAKKIRLPS